MVAFTPINSQNTQAAQPAAVPTPPEQGDHLSSLRSVASRYLGRGTDLTAPVNRVTGKRASNQARKRRQPMTYNTTHDLKHRKPSHAVTSSSDRSTDLQVQSEAAGNVQPPLKLPAAFAGAVTNEETRPLEPLSGTHDGRHHHSPENMVDKDVDSQLAKSTFRSSRSMHAIETSSQSTTWEACRASPRVGYTCYSSLPPGKSRSEDFSLSNSRVQCAMYSLPVGEHISKAPPHPSQARFQEPLPAQSTEGQSGSDCYFEDIERRSTKLCRSSVSQPPPEGAQDELLQNRQIADPKSDDFYDGELDMEDVEMIESSIPSTNRQYCMEASQLPNGGLVPSRPAPLHSDLFKKADNREEDSFFRFEDDHSNSSHHGNGGSEHAVAHLEHPPIYVSGASKIGDMPPANDPGISLETNKNNDETFRQPLVRSVFPNPLPDRSPIYGATNQTFLRTCFRIGEALNVGCHSSRLGKDTVLELFARVTSSEREARPNGYQHFVLRDLYHDNPPHLEGVFELCGQSELWDKDSRRFLEVKGRGLICRAIAKMKKKGMRWKLEILNIWEASWEDVQFAASIYARDDAGGISC